MYTNLHLNFHNLYKISNNNIRIADDNPNHIAIKNISFQIHKSPGQLSAAFTQGFCCCSGQLASENFAKLPNTKSTECSIVWRSGLPRHIFSMINQMAYHHYGEAEYVLPVVSRPKVKSRQRTGNRSSKPPTSWSMSWANA